MPKVLIVDDDCALLEALADLLRREGYDPVLAMDGQEALEYLRANDPPCAIVLDLVMPGMDGWAFREEQRRDAALAAIPTVIVTGTAHGKISPNGTRAGTVFPKPFDAAALLATLRRFCD